MVHIPDFLQELLNEAQFTPATEGLSGAMVWRVEMAGQTRYYLKHCPRAKNAELRAEADRLAWIAPLFPAPKIIAFGSEKGVTYLLTTALQGQLCSNLLSSEHSITIVRAIGVALRRLHELPIQDCPFDMRLARRLRLAQQRLNAGEVDLDNFDEERRGQSAETLWAEVVAAQPALEDVVVTHGDFCPPNILMNPDTLEITGFIDWGRAGIADRYQDLALMWRELEEPPHRAAFLEGYGGMTEPDMERIEYYQLVDEFF